MKGIYAYYDTIKEEIIYIGKDSYIDKKVRHTDHHCPSRYNTQQINRVLQNNPNRYVYKMIYECPPHLDDIDLNGLEMQYIEALNPKFNFTKGGEGLNGHTHTPQSLQKMSEARKGKAKGKDNYQWKDYARVVKSGKTASGTQNYVLKYEDKSIKYSVNRDKLQAMADNINKTKLEV